MAACEIADPHQPTNECTRLTVNRTQLTDTLLIIGREAERLHQYNTSQQRGSVTIALCPAGVLIEEVVFFVRSTPPRSSKPPQPPARDSLPRH
jgi:hypothetical protein